MYKYDELDAMSSQQLADIAGNLGVTKFDAENKEDLVYKILDQQAEVAANNSAASNTNNKNTPAKAKKKGRQPKSDNSNNELATEPSEATNNVENQGKDKSHATTSDKARKTDRPTIRRLRNSRKNPPPLTAKICP